MFSFLSYPVYSTLARLPFRFGDGSSLVLAYHNVVPPDEAQAGDQSLHLAATVFEAQLQIASMEADLVSLPDLQREHGRKGRRIAITVDDAYSGFIRHGLPICRAKSVVPTVFVAPGILDSFMPWDIRSASKSWGPQERNEFLLSGGVAAAAKASCTENLALPLSYRIASLDELKSARHHSAFLVGNHTMNHVNLQAHGAPFIRQEIESCETFLSRHFDVRDRVAAIAYPYGLAPSLTPDLALDELVEYGFRVSGGWIDRTRPYHGFAINRLNIPAGASLSYFRATLRGWLGSPR